MCWRSAAYPFFALWLRVVSPAPCPPTTTLEGEALRTRHAYDLPPGTCGVLGPPPGGRVGGGRRERPRRLGASRAVRRRPGADGPLAARRRGLRRRGARDHRREGDRVLVRHRPGDGPARAAGRRAVLPAQGRAD